MTKPKKQSKIAYINKRIKAKKELLLFRRAIIENKLVSQRGTYLFKE